MHSVNRGTSRATEHDVRARYLTLALETRRVVDLLLPLVESGQKSPTLLSALAVIDTLSGGGTAETLLAKLRAPGPRPIFEELLADEELETADERHRLVQELRNVVRDESGLSSTRASAKEAVLLLCVVEGRALHQFSRLSQHEGAISLTA